MRQQKMAPFKRLAKPLLGKMLQPEASAVANRLVPYLKAGHVQWGGVQAPYEMPMMWASADDIQNLAVQEGDLLICEGGEVGRAALVPAGLPPDTIIQNSLHLVRTGSSASARYLRYALAHIASSGWIDLICNKATIAHLTVEKLKELPVPTWSKGEQTCIVNFLDQQTARIDALIAEKDRLLDVLAEQRVSVAEQVLAENSTLTRGKLGFYVDLLPGYSFSSDEFTRNPDDIPLLRGVNVVPAKIRWDDTVYWTHEGAEALERFRLQVDDVVLGMDRPWISAGARVAMIDAASQGALLLQRVCRLRGKGQVKQRFIFYVLSSDAFRQSVEVDLTGVSVPHISPEQVLRFKVPVLSLDEQQRRCDDADSQIAQIVQLEAQTGEMLDRLREYRSSLISAAMTGQLDINSYKEAA